jgi:hypothetical protein
MVDRLLLVAKHKIPIFVIFVFSIAYVLTRTSVFTSTSLYSLGHSNPVAPKPKPKYGVVVWFAPGPYGFVGSNDCSSHIFCTVENNAKFFDTLYFVTNAECAKTGITAKNVVVVTLTYEEFNKTIEPYLFPIPPGTPTIFILSNYRKPIVLYVMEKFKLPNVYHFDTDVGIFELPEENNFLCTWPPSYANDLLINVDYEALKDILRFQHLLSTKKFWAADMAISYAYFMSQFPKDKLPCYYHDPRYPRLNHTSEAGTCDAAITYGEGGYIMPIVYAENFKPKHAMSNICDCRRPAAVFDIVEVGLRALGKDDQQRFVMVPRDPAKGNVSRILAFHFIRPKDYVCGLRIEDQFKG